MKTAPVALITLLTTQRSYWMADLYTITLINGVVLRYTSADVAVIESGRAFSSSILFTRGTTKVVTGVQVDTLDVTINASLSDLVSGIPWMQAIANGLLDGAYLQLERVFAASPSATPAGAVILFGGQVTETSVSSTAAKLTVSSDLILLNTQMPRNLYQPGCINSVYDTGCGASKPAFGMNGTVTSAGTNSTIQSNLTAVASGRFALGEIVFLTGANAGASRTVKTFSSGLFGLSYPLPNTPAIGDTFTAYAGCDKRYATCRDTFNNVIKWRGYPRIPVPETSM